VRTERSCQTELPGGAASGAAGGAELSAELLAERSRMLLVAVLGDSLEACCDWITNSVCLLCLCARRLTCAVGMQTGTEAHKFTN
jgi:hypothetical protein